MTTFLAAWLAAAIVGVAVWNVAASLVRRNRPPTKKDKSS